MNAVGVKLGNGWYSQEQYGELNYGPPRLIFSLTIRFDNGDEMQVVSNQTWTGRAGSIKHDSIYNGEFYDSRDDRLNWTLPGFKDSITAWITPELMSSPINVSQNGSLVLQDILPIRAGFDALHFEVEINSQHQGYLTAEDTSQVHGAKLTDGVVLKPIARWTSSSDVQTFDLGQTIAGLCRLRVNSTRGFGTYIRYGEALDRPDISSNFSTRNIFTENLCTATASDTYIIHGDPAGEIYEPTFTIHGFPYVAIFGPRQIVTIDDVNCSFIHSETTLKGHFTSSNPVVNQIQHNIQWTQLSNLMSVPTDCTARSERRGWMGDASLTVDEALYNFDLIKFYHYFLNLMVDDQLDNGELPNYLPVGNGPTEAYWSTNYPPDPNWGTALPTITCSLVKCQDCGKFANDVEIINSFPFSVNMNYQKQGPSISTAILDGNSVTMIQLRTAGAQVPDTVFCLKNLQALDIMNMKFVNGIVPDALSNLQSLYSLSITNTPINKVTDKVASLTNLQSLTMDNCGLTQIPNLSGLKKLNTLSLPNNHVSKVEGLYNVSQLFLYHNDFTEVPTQTIPGTLVRIYMNYNPVKQFPNVALYKNLTEVRLARTEVSIIPSNINELTRLSFLDLSFSKITTVPENILKLARLQYLVIQGNQFSAEEVNNIKNLFSTQQSGVQLLI